MQPIERYGVAALLFLVVTIGAVVLWDQAEPEPTGPDVVVASNDTSNTKSGPAGLSRNSVRRSGNTNTGSALEPKLELTSARKQSGPKVVSPSANQGLPGAEGDSWARGSSPSLNGRELPGAAALEQAAAADRARQEQEARQRAAAAFLAEVETTPAQPGRAVTVGNLVQDRSRANEGRATSSKPNKPKAAGRIYVVQPGDTLGQIAVDQLGGYRHLAALQAANPSIDAKSMQAGAKLVLPEVPDAPALEQVASARPTPGAKPTPGGRAYVVVAGDSLWAIAERELGDGMRHKEISALNPGSEQALVVGRRLVLPTGTTNANVTSESMASARTASAPSPSASSKPASSKRGVVN